MYLISYKFITPGWRNDAHNKCNLKIKPNNPDPVQKGIEFWVWVQDKYIMVWNSLPYIEAARGSHLRGR